MVLKDIVETIVLKLNEIETEKLKIREITKDIRAMKKELITVANNEFGGHLEFFFDANGRKKRVYVDGPDRIIKIDDIKTVEELDKKRMMSTLRGTK